MAYQQFEYMESGERPDMRRRRLLMGIAAAGAAVAVGGLGIKKLGQTPKSTETKPEVVSNDDEEMKTAETMLDLQIRFLDSLGEKDFNAMSRAKNARERQFEFMKLVDKRFNPAIEMSAGVSREVKGKILDWFDGLEAGKRNTTAEDLRKARNDAREGLEERLNYLKRKSPITAPDKPRQ